MTKYTTGTAATLTALTLLIANKFGVTMPDQVAASIVGIVAIGTSALFPRWLESRGIVLDAHPAALAGLLVTVAVWLAPLVGVDLSMTDAVTLVGALTLIVSLLTPRDPESHLLPTVYGDGANVAHEDATRDVDPVAAQIADQGREDRLDP